jgi:hypothetical protein
MADPVHIKEVFKKLMPHLRDEIDNNNELLAFLIAQGEDPENYT